MHVRGRQADFAVFDENGRLTAIARAKNRVNVDASWAPEWFASYMAREGTNAPPYVLLATPEKLYVWSTAAAAMSEPTAIADAQHIFSSYLKRPNMVPGELPAPAFEFLVGAWLSALSQHFWEPSTPDEIHALVDSGFLKAVENGRVVADIAA